MAVAILQNFDSCVRKKQHTALFLFEMSETYGNICIDIF